MSDASEAEGKSEIRNPKFEANSNEEKGKIRDWCDHENAAVYFANEVGPFWSIGLSNFGFVSDFDHRISPLA